MLFEKRQKQFTLADKADQSKSNNKQLNSLKEILHMKVIFIVAL